MSYPASVFRILIASPSDVVEERDIAEQTIQHWNDQNSAERQIVLLPVRWESHSTPTYGTRPQDAINRQVADVCDLVVAIFWTRIGSPTGAADSGTIEEIERAASSSKPVMLYFSRAKHDPEAIDLEQLRKLREFKTKTLPNALVEHYSTQIEFRDKFARQLDIQIRSLMAAVSTQQPEDSDQPPTDIQMHFADPKSGGDAGDHLDANSVRLEFTDFEQLPDYEEPDSSKRGGKLTTLTFGVDRPNRNFYRQYACYVAQRLLLQPIRFWLRNDGFVGARDVFVELSLTSDKGRLLAISPSDLPTSAPVRNTWLLEDGKHIDSPERLLSGATERWTTTIEIPALQPQRLVCPPTTVVVGATESCEIKVEAKIYADMLAAPVIKILTISVAASSSAASASEIVRDFSNKVGDAPPNMALNPTVGRGRPPAG